MDKFAFRPKLLLDLKDYNKEKLSADIMAGLIVGIVALPLAIAFGIASGVTSGITVTIFTTQVKDLFGLSIADVPADFVEKWIAYARHFASLDPWSTGVGLGSVALIALSPRLTRKVPGSLVAIVVMTVGIYLLQRYGLATQVETIGDRFMIKAELPGMNVPDLDWERVKQLVSPAITIAVLGAIESLLSATVADGVIGDHHDSNQELVGQGIANILSPLFGGIPATGAIARTMTNINNGGRTPVAGIVHAAVLLLIFLLLMPLARYIPMACLAGVLVVVSYNMSGWRTFRELLRNPKADVAVLLITFFLTVVFDLTVAIEFGLVLACLLFIKRVMETTEVNLFKDEIVPTDADGTALTEEHLHIPDHTEVYEINGPYFFGIANRFEEVVLQTKEQPKVRIIRMRKVPFIDSTGIHNLTNLCEMSHREGVHIILSGVNPKVHEALKKSGFYELLGKKNICDNIHTALEVARHYLAR